MSCDFFSSFFGISREVEKTMALKVKTQQHFTKHNNITLCFDLQNHCRKQPKAHLTHVVCVSARSRLIYFWLFSTLFFQRQITFNLIICCWEMKYVVMLVVGCCSTLPSTYTFLVRGLWLRIRWKMCSPKPKMMSPNVLFHPQHRDIQLTVIAN